MEDDKKFSFFFLGLGLGVAVGILFAPKAGTETRELLKEKADEGKEYLKRRGDEIKDSATEIVDRSKQALARQKDQLAAAVEAGKSAYREKTETAAPRRAGGEIIEGV